MEFMLAKKEDMEIITSLYKAAIGSLGCTWNEHYPTREHTQADLERGDLYCIKTESGEIIGVIAIDDDKEVETLECWSKNGAELSRLVVRENYQNQGIAGQLLKETMAVLKKRGYSYGFFKVADPGRYGSRFSAVDPLPGCNKRSWKPRRSNSTGKIPHIRF